MNTTSRRCHAGRRIVAAEQLEQRALLNGVQADATPVVAFRQPIQMPVQAGFTVSADFNDDGRLDVAASGQYSSEVVLLLGNGDGTFGNPQPLLRTAPYARLAAGDFNADGRIDLAVTSEPEDRVYVLPGNGDGTFRTPLALPVHDAPRGVTLADVNGDGRDDVVSNSSSRGGGAAGLLLARPDGTFAPMAAIAVGVDVAGLRVADIDSDGKADVAVDRPDNQQMSILWGNGDGTFAAPQSIGDPPVEGYMTAADFNRDGLLDFATRAAVTPAEAFVTVAMNLGNRTFSATRVAAPGRVSGLFVANVINDDNPDLFARGSYNMSWPQIMMRGNGDGTFTAGVVRTVTIAFGTPELSAAGDVNGDGLTDFFGYREGNPTYLLLAQPVVLLAPAAGLTGHQIPANLPLATFADNHRPSSPASSYTATVDWGDGRCSVGGVVVNADGTLTVTSGAGHTYPYNRSYSYTVTLTNSSGQSGEARGAAQVTDAPPPPTVTEFQASPTVQRDQWPDRIVPGPGQDLWFGLNPDPATYASQPRPSLIGRITPGGQTTYHTIPGTGAGPRLLASDAEGDAWFSITGGSPRLGQLTADGNVAEYNLPAAAAGAMTPGPENTIWFAVLAPSGGGVDRLGRVTQSGEVTLVSLSRATAAAADMVLGPDGNFWLAQPAASMVTRVTPAGVVTEFPVAPTPSTTRDPVAIAAGPDGNVWFVETAGKAVGRITPEGEVSRFPVPAVSGGPTGIAAGPDGAVWVVLPHANRIGRVTTAGSFSDYTLPTTTGNYPGRPGSGPYPFALAVVGDGNVWFTEQAAINVARLNLAEAIRLEATPVEARMGVPFDGEVAGFTDPQAGHDPDDYDALIDWGDGVTTRGTITDAPGGDGFLVSGSHTYAAEAARVVRVTVTPFGDVSTSVATPVVVDHPLTVVETFKVVANEDFSAGEVPLLRFTDPDPDGAYGPFTATVDWGDGSTPSAATVIQTGTSGPPGLFEVRGAHTYSREGTYAVRVRVADAGAAVEAVTSATVLAALKMQPMVTTPVGSARYVVTGDFTGDGRPDVLASSDQGSTPVKLLPGRGDGTLEQPRDATTGRLATTRPVVADFNRDGKTDFAAITFAGPGETRRLSLFLGRGDGTFTAPVTIATASQPAVTVLATDLNGDGATDLVTLGQSQPDPNAGTLYGRDLSISINNGDGTFRAGITQRAPWAVSQAVAADFDGDGDIDLAAAAERWEAASPAPLVVFPGRGDGTFGPATFHASPNGTLVAGDFNGDGRADLARGWAAENVLFVLSGRADGTFDPPLSQILLPSHPPGRPAPASPVQAVDTNGDGLLDLLGLNGAGSDGGVGVHLGHGDGTFSRPLYFRPDSNFGGWVSEVTAADLNGDGRQDVVAGIYYTGRVGVLVNTPYTLTMAQDVTAHEGTTSEMLLATLRHEDPPIGGSAGFTATAHWGDGSSSPVRVVPNASGGLDVVGSHTYAEVGQYRVEVVVVSPHGIRESGNTKGNVANAPFSVDPAAPAFVAAAPGTVAVATIRDTNRFSLPSDFSARIDWGDGYVSPGFIRHTGGGRYAVYGTHSFAVPGQRNVAVTVQDAGGGSGAATARATVAAPLNGGGSISGTVYHDADGDRMREFGEPGVPLATVYVDENGNGVRDPDERRVATTSATGEYTLADLPAGAWTIRHEPPPGYRQTSPTPGEPFVVTMSRGQIIVGRDFADTRPSAGVVQRAAFYNNSGHDGRDVGADTRDDDAIARDKEALLPGQPGGFANYTSYSRGITGVMIDLFGPPAGVTPVATDFTFRVGTGGDPAVWATAPAPTAVNLRRGAGAAGADRITLTWADGAILNSWLEVTVNPGSSTGLAAADVFYFGNLVGDAGGPGTPRVDARDLVLTRAAFGKTTPAALNAYDFNRDGVIDAVDVMAVRRNLGRALAAFVAPTAPPAAAVASSAETPIPAPATRASAPPHRRRALDETRGLLE